MDFWCGNHAKILLAKKARNDYLCPLVDGGIGGLFQLPKMLGIQVQSYFRLLFLFAAKLISVQNCSLHHKDVVSGVLLHGPFLFLFKFELEYLSCLSSGFSGF